MQPAAAYTPMFVLLPLIVVMMLVVAGLVAGVALLSNERTRFAGGVILGLLGLLVVGGGGLLMAGLFYARTEVHREAQSNTGYRSYTESVTVAPTPLPAVPIEVVTEPDAGPAEKPAEKEEPATTEAETTTPTTEPAKTETKAPPAEAASPARPATSPRPEWLDRKPSTNSPTYTMVAVVGPYTSRIECEAQLPAVAQRAVDEFVAAYLGSEWAGHVQLSHEYIRSQLVKADWEEPVQASFGPMVQLHVLLEFDHKVKEHLKAERDRLTVVHRLGVLGTGVAAALLVLCIAYVVLKLDLLSGGQRRGRLAVAGCLAMVAIVIAAGFTVQAFYQTPSPPLMSAPQSLSAIESVGHEAVALTPAEAFYRTHASWARLAVVVAAVCAMVGLVGTGMFAVRHGGRHGRLIILLGATVIAATIAALVAAS